MLRNTRNGERHTETSRGARYHSRAPFSACAKCIEKCVTSKVQTPCAQRMEIGARGLGLRRDACCLDRTPAPKHNRTRRPQAEAGTRRQTGAHAGSRFCRRSQMQNALTGTRRSADGVKMQNALSTLVRAPIWRRDPPPLGVVWRGCVWALGFCRGNKHRAEA